MTISIVNDCLLLKDEKPEKIKQYFASKNITVFDAIFSKYKPLEAKQIVLYILCAHSEDSPLVVLRRDAKEEKKAICEYLQIPEYLQGQLLDFTDKEVKDIAVDYLSDFAGQEFKTLMFMKIQLADMEKDITSRKFSSVKDEVYYYDIKEHGRAIQECRRLATEISKLESAISSKTKYLGLDNMREWLSKAAKKNSSSTSGVYRGSGLEHSDLIK